MQTTGNASVKHAAMRAITQQYIYGPPLVEIHDDNAVLAQQQTALHGLS